MSTWKPPFGPQGVRPGVGPNHAADVDVGREIAALAADYQRLQRQLRQKQAQLAALTSPNAEAGPFPADFDQGLPRRYSIEFQFAPPVRENIETPPTGGAIAVSLQPQERSVTIEAGTVFRCAYMESFLRAIGSAEDPFSGDSVTVQATLPWNVRRYYFDYLWNVRDTGSDREWCDAPQPSWFGGGGYTGPFWLPRRNILSGGTILFAKIAPFRNVDAADFGGSIFAGGTVSQYILHLSFVGHQVPDTSAL